MAIREIRLPDGRDVRIDEWLHWPLYSTIEFAAASFANVNLRAFSYVRGQRVPSVGLATRLANQNDTNMAQRQQMGYDESFIMYAITYEAFGLSSSGNETATAGQPLQAEEPMISAINLRFLQIALVTELMLGAGQRKPQLRYPFAFLPQSVGTQAWSSGGSIEPTAVLPPAVSFGTGGHINPQNQRRLELPITIDSERQMYLRTFLATTALESDVSFDQNVRIRYWLDGMKRRPVG